MIVLALTTTLAARPMVVAYVPNWIDLAAFAKTIDYAKVTQLNLAFENPIDEAGHLSFNPADKVLVETAHAHGVKVLLSMGGGGVSGDARLSDRFSDLTAEAKRASFARQLAEYVTDHGFDGLDVDLEGEQITSSYGPFVSLLGREFRHRHKLLTAALSMGNGGDRVPAAALKAFDSVNVMAYDATGPWNPHEPGPHASMAFAKASVEFWRKRGLPKSKTVLGVPFYGYGFGNDAAGGEWSYAKILATHPGAEKLDIVGSTVYYNGVPTIRAKARYIREEGLAGAMIWSLDSDAPGANSLLTALDAGLRKR